MNINKCKATGYLISVFIVLGFITLKCGFLIELVWAHEWKAPMEAIKKVNPKEKSVESINSGKRLFEQFCSNCHGTDGTGGGLLSYTLSTETPNLVERAGHHSDGDFAWKISNGRGEMPAFRDKLSMDQVWDITNFIKSLSLKN